MTVHGPLLTCFLAKLAVGSDRGDHRRGGGDDAANAPPPTACSHCEPTAAPYAHPADSPPCAVCRHRLPALHLCRVASVGCVFGLTLLVAAGASQWTQLVFLAWVLLLSLVILFDCLLSRDSHPRRGSSAPTGPS